MVTKPVQAAVCVSALFESCVVLDGDKTRPVRVDARDTFESCVVLDGDKTILSSSFIAGEFESCVVLDGDKTCTHTRKTLYVFESCVVLDGDKAPIMRDWRTFLFESCVVLDGDKTRAQSRSANAPFASCTVSNHPPKPICEAFRRRMKVILPEKTTQQAARHAAGPAVQDSDKHFARSGRHGDACRGDCRRAVENRGKFLRYMPQIRHILACFFPKFIVSHGR